MKMYESTFEIISETLILLLQAKKTNRTNFFNFLKLKTNKTKHEYFLIERITIF